MVTKYRETNKEWERRAVAAVRQSLPGISQKHMLRVESEAKRIVYLGHPEHLNRQTGTLGRSITTETEVSPETVTSTTGTNIVYARIHEFGGIVRRETSKIIIPARPTLTPAFEATAESVSRLIRSDVAETIRGVK